MLDFQKRGFQRVKIDGKMYEVDEVPAAQQEHRRTTSRSSSTASSSAPISATGWPIRSRPRSAWPTASRSPKTPIAGEETIFSAKFACPVSGFTIPEIEPRLFSFNNPFGACPACDGLGTKLYFDPDLVVHDHGRSLAEGAVSPWSHSSSPYYTQTLESIARHFKQSMHTPWRDLPEKMRQTILYGSDGEPIRMTYDDGLQQYSTERPFEGVLPNMERRFRETDSAWVREELGRYQNAQDLRGVPAARGSSPRRWRSRSPASSISEAAALSIAAAVRLVLPASPRR